MQKKQAVAHVVDQRLCSERRAGLFLGLHRSTYRYPAQPPLPKQIQLHQRLTVALTMMAVVMCAVVTMAATGEKNGDFDTVVARRVFVKNEAGGLVVTLSANHDGDGLVYTTSAKGNDLVTLRATVNDKGMIMTYQPNGKALVEWGVNPNGGLIDISNKTGESIANMYADEYGNGVVYAGNRKGEGRTLQPGP